jgi:hypothetical protein
VTSRSNFTLQGEGGGGHFPSDPRGGRFTRAIHNLMSAPQSRNSISIQAQKRVKGSWSVHKAGHSDPDSTDVTPQGVSTPPTFRQTGGVSPSSSRGSLFSQTCSHPELLSAHSLTSSHNSPSPASLSPGLQPGWGVKPCTDYTLMPQTLCR